MLADGEFHRKTAERVPAVVFRGQVEFVGFLQREHEVVCVLLPPLHSPSTSLGSA